MAFSYTFFTYYIVRQPMPVRAKLEYVYMSSYTSLNNYYTGTA